MKNFSVTAGSIVLIDDDLFVNKINERLISIVKKEVKVNSFTCAACALNYISNNPTDLVIMDAEMKKINAWQFLETIEKQGINTNLIMLSSCANSSDRRKAAGLTGIKDFLYKPLHYQHIKDMLE